MRRVTLIVSEAYTYAVDVSYGEGDGKEINITYVTTETRRGRNAWLARCEGNSAVSWSGKNLAKRKMSEDEIDYGRRKLA